MPFETLAALALPALAVLLLLALLLRRPRVRLPPEWPQQLQALQAQVQQLQLQLAKSEGAQEALAEQLRGFGQGTQQLIDERLAQVVQDARAGRAELQAAFAQLQTQLAQQRVDERADAARARQEQAQALQTFRAELAQTAQQLAGDALASREAIAQSTQQFAARLQERFDALGAATRTTFDSLKGDIHTQLTALQQALRDQLAVNTRQLSEATASQQQGAEQLRAAMNERLAAMQSDNAAKLEEMRRTVDEKLHATLEQRLGESFKLVSERLELVHKGLGEMQTLAGSVGDLKRVMTNVKTRGTWGEMQLAALIDNVLTSEQYARNVKTVPGSDELVEFAIRLPGKSADAPVWLPVDSKYPVEHYQRLIDAMDAADKPAMAAAGNAFESSIRLEAKKIAAKYVAPPYTTDFAVLYLPTEGLFAEVMRRPGLVEAVQNEARVVISGPANFAALLSSLQMGFKTLAIEKRSSEVWSVLGQVKSEFAKFGDAVEQTRKSIDAAAKRFEQVGVRTRAIERKLRAVQELPLPEDDAPLLAQDAQDDADEEPPE